MCYFSHPELICYIFKFYRKGKDRRKIATVLKNKEVNSWVFKVFGVENDTEITDFNRLVISQITRTETGQDIQKNIYLNFTLYIFFGYINMKLVNRFIYRSKRRLFLAVANKLVPMTHRKRIDGVCMVE